MLFLRTIIALLALVVFTAGAAGVPTLIHYCGGEPVAEACDPVECCSDEAETAEDACCSDLVEIHNVDTDAAVTPAPSLPPPAEFHGPALTDPTHELLESLTAATLLAEAPDRGATERPPRTVDRLARLDVFLI